MIGAAFIAICIGLIAGTAGAATYLAFGFNAAEAFIVAIAVLTSLGLYNAVSAGLGLRMIVSRQLRDLSRTGTGLAHQVAEMDRRLAGLESRFGSAFDKTHAAVDPLLVDVDDLGRFMGQLAKTVANHEAVLKALDQGEPAEGSFAKAATAEAKLAPAAATDPATVGDSAEMLATIRDAIAAKRVELYLQPIVTLPDRKVSYYEATTRLRSKQGELLAEPDFISQAERGSLMPKIDNLAMVRSAQVVRRLLLKNREIGVFCNMSFSTLTDADVFPRVLEFLDANRAIAASIVLEFAQGALRAAGAAETESLAALAERGFRFSLDHVVDLGIEPRDLATRGFRFIKIPASLLLRRANVAALEVDPGDIADLLVRFGIDVIADNIENEVTVVELLDRDIRFGQGLLFSPPRPVRAEAIEGIAERQPLMQT
jgi:cyclic-di-GMP phosphodiesterase, flagellum assembly factor TipF